MQPDSPAFLWDALDAARKVSEFVAGESWETYIAGSLLPSAVERQIEIVGEALNNLRKADPETAALIPDINQIVGMRNVLVHGYAEVDSRRVWSVATEDVPALIAVLAPLVAEATEQEV